MTLNSTENTSFTALKAAFPHTLPVLAGYGFLGMAYGVYMRVSGFSIIYPLIISIIVFGGSLQFVGVTLLLAPYAPLQTFLMALMIQARHLFYGIAMLDKYKGYGWKKFYLIFAMSDETFSVNCSVEVPQNVDRGWFLFWVSALDQSYWVIAATLGSAVGSLIKFDVEGLDFVMTAMFVVIFLEQWMKEKKHYTAWIGLICSAVCLYFFGSGSFIIPTMICILVCLAVFRKPIEKAGDLT